MADYQTLRQQHVALFSQMVAAHVQRLHWPADQLRIERRQRLRDLLRIAIARSPWHRKRLASVDPDRFDERDLRQLPPMSKEDLTANWDDIVTDRRLTLEGAERHLGALTSDAYLLDEFHVIASGGSTGTRGVYAYGWEPWAVAGAGFLRTNVWDRTVSPDLASAPNTIAMVAARHATHMTSAIAETFSNPAIKVVTFPIALAIEDIVAGLNEVQPVTIITYASALGILTREARAGRLRIRPRRLVSTSEPLLPEVRRDAEDVFQAPLANIYGTSEAGPVAIGCWRSAGMHLCDDLVIVEPVDRAGRHVGVGVRSDKIYLTSIANPTLPLIRFELTDQIEFLEGTCPCGSAHRLIADVDGRMDDVFEYEQGVLVHPHVFRSVLCREREIVEYQVRQTEDGADVLAVGMPLDTAAVERAIGGELQRLGVKRASVRVRTVDHLERQRTGKMRRFVPLTVKAARPT
jgi:phenylacetate-coenzyme A ligase PaaK-like adenylate-forming protein